MGCLGLVVGLPCVAWATLKVMTYNVWFDKPNHPWAPRAEGVYSQIEKFAPHVMALQEPLIHQVVDIHKRFPHYQWVGKGREDGQNHGEFTPIFFDSRHWKLLSTESFWLSGTPEAAGSISWGAWEPRVATTAFLESVSDGEKIYVVNIHLDHLSWVAREKGTELILEKLRPWRQKARVILLGDLNSSQNEGAYGLISRAGYLFDAEDISLKPHEGPDWSFITLGGWITRRLDFVFVDPRFRVLSHRISDFRWQGEFPSDHLPVLVELQ